MEPTTVEEATSLKKFVMILFFFNSIHILSNVIVTLYMYFFVYVFDLKFV